MKLNDLLNALELSASDLARKVDVAPQTISRIASGVRKPSSDLAHRIATATNTDSFIGESGIEWRLKARRRARV